MNIRQESFKHVSVIRMCDQSEVLYNPKDVVWVKLGPVWWPGVVAEKEEIPPEILKTLRKTPIAIVKFFQETEL